MAVPVVDAVVARRNRLRAGIAGVRARYEWLDHLSRTGERYFQQRGNHFAAAVTFFSVLTAVPLLMVAFGAAGFVLWLNPTLLDDLRDAITAAVPGALSDAVIPFIDEAVAQRNAVAGLGLLAALWSGIWWTSNMREAVSAQWALPALRPTSVARFWHDLRVLVILGVTLLGSISVSVLATGALDVVLVRLGLTDGGVGALVPAAAVALLGLGTGFLVFYWILTRLPRAAVPRRGVIRAALVGAVGFEVLKQATALTIGSVTGTPGGAVFGPLLGLLLFCYLVSRFALLVSAWAATTRGNELPTAPSEPASTDAPPPGAEPAPPRTPSGEPAPLPTPEPPSTSSPRRTPGPPGASRGALGVALGVGMLLGAWLGRLRRSSSGGA
ncbi:MAG TPA: YhjD/YihY/BrkB family envelope integrity protein [Pseudonocardia sp.]|nr:YhjD/YihY/BrkB family envelope integrity protein [Pseudonocardia sp.]